MGRSAFMLCHKVLARPACAHSVSPSYTSEKKAQASYLPASLSRKLTSAHGKCLQTLSRRYPRPVTTVCSVDDEDNSAPKVNRLALAVQMKQREIAQMVATLEKQDPGNGVQARLASVRPASQPLRLTTNLISALQHGQRMVVVEAARRSDAEEDSSVAARCRQYASWGADAILLRLDMEPPDARRRLLSSCCLAAGNAPVLVKDWIIHPLQLVEALEAGAAGVVLVKAVLGGGLMPLLKYATAAGLDAVVEVINAKEVAEVADTGALLYGVNVSVRLSLASIPGFRQQIASSLVKEVPEVWACLVGVQSVVEARDMMKAGAGAFLLQSEALTEGATTSPEDLIQEIRAIWD